MVLVSVIVMATDHINDLGHGYCYGHGHGPGQRHCYGHGSQS